MGKKSTGAGEPSRVCYETLERWARQRIQEHLQGLLEEEVQELLGREKWQRKAGVDAAEGYRNGYGKSRRLTMSGGTIELRRPRVRGLEQRFESAILPLFARRTKEVGELLPELYLHGLAEGDFDLALRGLLGEGAPLSASTVARLKERWQGEYAAWKQEGLEGLQAVYLWADAVYVKAGLEKEKAALLVIVLGLSDGSKRIAYLGSGYRESKESWAEALRDLKHRGLQAPRLAIGDGALGLWSALTEVFPSSQEQRCWNHKLVNVIDQVPRSKQAEAKGLVAGIPYCSTRQEAERGKRRFEEWCTSHGLEKAAETLGRDWDRMMSFYQFPKEHWKHIRTTNVIESPFAALRLRTDAAKRFKKVENATAVIWKALMVAQKRFRKLDAPELLKEVWGGVEFTDGVAINVKGKQTAA
jgi:transposase-like protein